MESCQKGIHNTDQAVARALVNEFKNTAYSFLSLQERIMKTSCSSFCVFFFPLSLPVIKNPLSFRHPFLWKGLHQRCLRTKNYHIPLCNTMIVHSSGQWNYLQTSQTGYYQQWRRRTRTGQINVLQCCIFCTSVYQKYDQEVESVFMHYPEQFFSQSQSDLLRYHMHHQ